MTHRTKFGSPPVRRAALAVLLLVTPGAARAATLHVPADHGTIQAAVSAAAAGDTVLVAPGEYRELIRMKNGVVLRAAAGPDSTVLYTPGLGASLMEERLLEFEPGVDRSTVVEGFTMDAEGIRGAAVYCEQASPTIRGNVIRDFGWGVNLRDGSDALLERNVIEGGRSFGVLIFASSPELRGNTITDNQPRGISISGRKSRPVIGGRPEWANRIYGQTFAVVNESRNDIDATYNDWGWATVVEMERLPYPADITAIADGNDVGETARGRGVVDYRHWFRPKEEDVAAAAAAAPSATPDAAMMDGADANAASPDAVAPAGGDSAGVTAAPAPEAAATGAPRWLLPAALGVGLVLVFVIVSRRNSA